MRLFDHLAAGRPIVATNACPQVYEFQDCVMIASTGEEFLGKLRRGLTQIADQSYGQAMKQRALENTWSARALVLSSRIDAEMQIIS